MRKLIAIILFSVLGILHGCINEDDSCYIRGNCVFTFAFTDKDGNDIFDQNIDNLEIVVFDSNGNFILSRKVTKKQLAKSRRVAINLPPGSYKVVYWANAGQSTTIYNAPKLADSFVAFSNPDGALDSIDPLFYAEADNFDITVVGQQIVQAIMLQSAHVVIDVQAKGFVDPDGRGGNYPPKILIGRFCAGYNYRMQPRGTGLSFNGGLVTPKIARDVSNTYTTRVITPLFSISDPITVKLYKQSDSSLATSLDLRKFIADNNIDLTSRQEVKINILFEYVNGEVTITISGLEKIPVEVS